MTRRGHSAAACLTAMLLAAVLSVAALAGLIWGCGTSAPMMAALMRKHTAPADTLLPASEYDGMTMMITGYLAGDVEPFQYIFTDDSGIDRLCFNKTEQLHMADCRELFALCRRVLWTAVIIALVCVIILALIRWNKAFFVGGAAGMWLMLLVPTVLFVWGTAHFEQLFILFHESFFSNDLWMMNYSRDMIIRLMPIEFFMDYAAIVGFAWVGLILLSAVGLTVKAVRCGSRRRQSD